MRDQRLNVLKFQPSYLPPETAGLHLVVTARMQFVVCEAIFNADGDFSHFRRTDGAGEDMSAAEVLAFALLLDPGNLVQDLYSSPDWRKSPKTLAEGNAPISPLEAWYRDQYQRINAPRNPLRLVPDGNTDGGGPNAA